MHEAFGASWICNRIAEPDHRTVAEKLSNCRHTVAELDHRAQLPKLPPNRQIMVIFQDDRARR